MTELETATHASARLLELAGRLETHRGFAEVVASLKAGNSGTIGGVWGSSCALVAAALATHNVRPLLVVCASGDDIDAVCDDLALFTPLVPERFPAFESSRGERLADDEIYGDRLRLLKRLLADDPPRLVVTSIQALLQGVPQQDHLARQTRRIAVGDDLSVEALSAWLVKGGFQNTTAVELPGEFSLRGGILDLFAHDWFNPVRLELFGDQVESLRQFEVATQRSLATLSAIDVTLPGDPAEDRAHLADYLPAGSWVYLIEPDEINDQARHFLERAEHPDQLHTITGPLRQLLRHPSAAAAGIPSTTLDVSCHLQIESVERFSGDVHKVREELDTAAEGQDLFIVCQTSAEAQRLAELLAGTRLAAAGRLHFPEGRLKAGFRLVSESVALVSGNELFHRAELYRTSRRRLGRAIDSFLELREGDYVVHLSHGIARYRGLKLLEKEQQAEEHLVLEFRDDTKVYVPSSKIELVQKYVGGAKSRPVLAKIGGRNWGRQKKAAEAAVNDLAVDMLTLQAARAAKPGISFVVDTPWQGEFDASFPYVETADQLTAMTSIRTDMLAPRPMDRLLCGDVGFGKTELAMRAAFKAVDSGYQVGVLVPTTILAEQHRRTFIERMAEFPFTIASLSRFSSPKEQRQVLERLAAGGIDICIGTHRLAQRDVAFFNLGLIIIDEEQRFGVEVKERLKTIRQTVDVLTMTATPIPRTLHLSLLGVRDISNLETAPSERLAVETRVTRFDEELIRHAVLRELSRGGQIFFVHNRVHDIQAVAARLLTIVPEARIAIGHGQMPEDELEQVMLDFVAHRFDLLLATTIVESGLDIPNANTIFIDDADRYGLADLHQLRGRVGRYKHRAYCYLLVDPNKHLSPNAARRLRAIEEFSDMGAGFAIAMRDLELRGAGNILGTQQSGHIATVGYELYCDLLEKAVRRLKQLPPKKTVDVTLELPGEVYLPRTYVPDVRQKIDLYRRIARIGTQQELDDLRAELADRFGPVPPQVERMLELAQIRIWAHAWQIRAIHLEEGYVVFDYTRRKRVEQLAARAPGKLRIVDEASAYLPLGKQTRDVEAVYDAIKSMLRPE